ncbi:MAG: magnesium protoporphyrin IX methyltransferase [Rhodocyclaceae bacterium]|nr:magnesium protoporphyrin IX methyltransferase [Rhodocyclaceae bacterium]
MSNISYQRRRSEIECYFDRTAVDAWRKLTSDAPIGRIRTTVRAGRDEMRNTLLSWLPENLEGLRLLDAGCGTGALAVEAAHRGATVLAIDLSPTLVDLARDRAPKTFSNPHGKVEFQAGDMLDPALGEFDHVVGMDSVIHYDASDVVKVLESLGARTRGSILFTYAPSNPFLETMIAIGRLLPRRDRAPWISPIATKRINHLVATSRELSAWRSARTKRVSRGFYTSQALELVRA